MPSQSGPLADGIVAGTSVTCPLHNWRFCLESGRVTKPCDEGQRSVRTFDIKVENGLVLLAVSDLDANAQAA